jgi:hypothetical protein
MFMFTAQPSWSVQGKQAPRAACHRLSPGAEMMRTARRTGGNIAHILHMESTAELTRRVTSTYNILHAQASTAIKPLTGRYSNKYMN